MKISPDVLDKFQPNLINLEEVNKLRNIVAKNLYL